MYKKILIALAATYSIGAVAQVPPLDQQIQSVNGALIEQQDREQAQRDAYDAQVREQQARADAAAHEQAVVQAKARARAQARADAAQAAANARAAKAESYADQERELELQSKRLDLQAKATDVSRENDAINVALAREKAKNDLIQSKADANRNVSSGLKTNLEKSGEAEIKKSSSWYNHD